MIGSPWPFREFGRHLVYASWVQRMAAQQPEQRQRRAWKKAETPQSRLAVARAAGVKTDIQMYG